VSECEQDGFFGKEGTQQLRQTAPATPFENQGSTFSASITLFNFNYFLVFFIFLLHLFSLTDSLGIKLGNHCRGTISDQRCCVSETYWDTETSTQTSSFQSGQRLFLFVFFYSCHTTSVITKISNTSIL